MNTNDNDAADMGVDEVARLLGFKREHIPLLVENKLLKPATGEAVGPAQRFSRTAIAPLLSDRKWRSRAKACVLRHSGSHDRQTHTEMRRTVRKVRTLPASQWHRSLEEQLTQLSARRHELRQEIQAQRHQRCANNPHGEKTLSLKTATKRAKAAVLGKEWEQGLQSLNHATQRVRSVRRQIERLRLEQQRVCHRSRVWTYWLFKAPMFQWKAHPLKAQLQQSERQRQAALKSLRKLRLRASASDVRCRIHELTESLLVQDERLKHSLGNLRESQQGITAQISKILQLTPQLRALGEMPVTMEQHFDFRTKEACIPVPVQSLGAAAHTPSSRVRRRIG